MDGVGLTALMTAAARAHERRRPGALIDDPWAEALAGARGVEILRLTDPWLFQYTYPSGYVLRHRVYDDLILRWVGDGFDQIVIVAAGLDTRAFRLPLPARAHVFELDQESVLAHKHRVLNAANASPRCERTAIPCDLRANWTDSLVANGYDPKLSSVWVAEGLLFYLSEAQAADLVEGMARLAAPGSHLLTQTMVTTVNADFAARFASLGAPFTFLTDDGEGFLRAHAWKARTLSFERLHIAPWATLEFRGWGSTLVGERPSC